MGRRGGSEMRWLSDVDGKVRHRKSTTANGIVRIQINGQIEPHLFEKQGNDLKKTGQKGIKIAKNDGHVIRGALRNQLQNPAKS